MCNRFIAALAACFLTTSAQASEFSGFYIGGGVGYSRSSGTLTVERTDEILNNFNFIDPDVATGVSSVINVDDFDFDRVEDDLDIPDFGSDAVNNAVRELLMQTVGVVTALAGPEVSRVVADRISLAEELARALTLASVQEQLGDVESFIMQRAAFTETLVATSVHAQATAIAQFDVGPFVLGVEGSYNHSNLKLEYDCSVVHNGDKCTFARKGSVVALARVGVPWGSFMPYITGGVDYSWNSSAAVTGTDGTVLASYDAKPLRPTFGAGIQAAFGRLSIDAQYLAQPHATVTVTDVREVGEVNGGTVQTTHRSTADMNVTHALTVRALWRLN